MAVDYLDDSYRRCLEELRQRYKYRGISRSSEQEIPARTQKETRAHTAVPEAYMFFDADSKIAERYRSGEYCGNKYMTSDDFVRYFRTRRAFYMPETVRELSQKSENTAVPQRRVSAGAPSARADANGKEGHLVRTRSVLKKLFETWFPVERLEGRTETRGFRLPAAALSGIAVFTISLGLIVSGSVLLGNASGEVGKMQSTITQLEAEQVELQGQLDLKYNVSQIAEDAKTLGMIQRQYADCEYLIVSEEERIIIPEDREPENIGLSALLAAFGIED